LPACADPNPLADCLSHTTLAVVKNGEKLMSIAVVFSLLSLALLTLAFALALLNPLAWALLWPAAGTGLVALAYFTAQPKLLGKRPSGRLTWWAAILYLPLLAISLTVWQLIQLFMGENASDEVTPGIHVGRWPRIEELPAGAQAVVDLTAEFPARPGVRAHPGYVNHPILDTTSPSPAVIESIVRPLVDVPGPILVHCAVGHGRSAMIAAALGLARGDFDDPEQAVAALQRARPRVHLRPVQAQRLREWFVALR